MRSSLKPEAAIYTPQSIGNQDPQLSDHATGDRLAKEGAGHIAMANLVKQRKEQTLEAVQSFRNNSMDKDFEADKKLIEYRTDNMRLGPRVADIRFAPSSPPLSTTLPYL